MIFKQCAIANKYSHKFDFMKKVIFFLLQDDPLHFATKKRTSPPQTPQKIDFSMEKKKSLK